MPKQPYSRRASFLTKPLCLLSWLTVLALWASAASVYVPPSWSRYAGVLGLAFPGCLVAVGGMGAVCLLLKPRLALIALAGVVGCCGSVRDYFPVNLSSPAPKGCLKVMTYNVMSFASWKKDNGEYVIPRYVCENRPDIACLQEATFTDDVAREGIVAQFRRYGYHYSSVKLGESSVALASRYPIVGEEELCHTVSNGAAAFYVELTPKDTLVIVNVHFESMRLSGHDRSQYHKLIRNLGEADTIQGKRAIVSKIASASLKRGAEADTVVAFLDRMKGKNVMLMGDFNDTPISYAHHAVCSRLTDAFRATGNGVGRSFNRDGIFVRIDHLFCSADWKPFACRVDNSVSFSDHYPIVCYMKREK